MEGKDFTSEMRFAGNVADRVPAFAVDLVQRRVALIIVLDTLAANARTGPRPPDRIHNTISLRLFPWTDSKRMVAVITRSIYGFGRLAK